MGLPVTWCLPTQRLPFREGDQQTRSINEAEDGRLHSAGGTDNKKPRVPAGLSCAARYFYDRSFLIAPAKICPTSSGMLKSRNIAISASSPRACDVSGRSVDTSLPRYRIIIEIFAERAGRTSAAFCSCS